MEKLLLTNLAINSVFPKANLPPFIFYQYSFVLTHGEKRGAVMKFDPTDV